MGDPISSEVYVLDVEWLLAWFPNRSSSTLPQVRMRGGNIGHKNIDPVFQSGNREIHFLGQGGADGDPIAPGNRVGAFIDVGLFEDNNRVFAVKIEVFSGSIRQSKDFVLEANTTTPFMLNVQFRGEDEISGGTTTTLQGIFVTSIQSPSLLLSAEQSLEYKEQLTFDPLRP